MNEICYGLAKPTHRHIPWARAAPRRAWVAHGERSLAPVKSPVRLLLALSVAVAIGCGDSGGEDPVVIDGGFAPDADTGGTPVECNPVSQTGCAAGQKCAFVLDDVETGIGHTGCIADGNAGMGQACTNPVAIGEADSCLSGLHCYLGECAEICTTQNDTCGGGGSCVGFDGLDFDVCLAGCDALAQDCPEGQGCYLTQGGSVCAAVVGGEPPGTGQLAGGPCDFLNECGAGLGCFDDGMGGGVCLTYCNFNECFDEETQQPVACGCGGCNPADLCGGIVDEDTVGVCLEATLFMGCDCQSSPICPEEGGDG